MDFETFSKTYWYIWFLLTLLVVILLILNGIGIVWYRKRRREFLNRSTRNISMNELSTVNNENCNYRKMSILSAGTDNSFVINARLQRIIYSRQTIISVPRISTIDETSETESTLPSNQMNGESDIDLSLEEFQRQALKEHNSMRTRHKKGPLKLNEALNIYAQYWAEQCAKKNRVVPSRLEWRLHCKGQPLGENIVSVKSIDEFDGTYFTALIMANGNQSHEVDCVLNEITTEIGFGRAQSQSNDDTEQPQWIGVAYYYPYRQLTTVQS